MVIDTVIERFTDMAAKPVIVMVMVIGTDPARAKVTRYTGADTDVAGFRARAIPRDRGRVSIRLGLGLGLRLKLGLGLRLGLGVQL